MSERRFKGRGTRSADDQMDVDDDGKSYDRLGNDKPSDAPTPQKSIEGFAALLLSEVDLTSVNRVDNIYHRRA